MNRKYRCSQTIECLFGAVARDQRVLDKAPSVIDRLLGLEDIDPLSSRQIRA